MACNGVLLDRDVLTLGAADKRQASQPLPRNGSGNES